MQFLNIHVEYLLTRFTLYIVQYAVQLAPHGRMTYTVCTTYSTHVQPALQAVAVGNGEQ